MSIVSEEKVASSESGEKDKELGSNLKHQEYTKHNKFMADKLLEDFNKQNLGANPSAVQEAFLSKANFVVQDSFKDLIAWQNENIEGKHNPTFQPILQHQQGSNLFSGGGQSQNLFSNTTQNMGLQNQLFSNQGLPMGQSIFQQSNSLFQDSTNNQTNQQLGDSQGLFREGSN